MSLVLIASYGTLANTERFNEAPIKIVVGSNKEVFYLDEAALRTTSEFFDAMLNKAWKEGEAKEVLLLEDDAGNLRHYFQCLYTQKIFCKKKGLGSQFSALVDLYGLGEKLLDRKFQNSVVSAILATMHDSNRGLKMVGINRVYEQTPPGAPLRTLLVDFYIRYTAVGTTTRPGLQTSLNNANRDFLTDLAIASLIKRKLTPETTIELDKALQVSSCAYHYNKSSNSKNTFGAWSPSPLQPAPGPVSQRGGAVGGFGRGRGGAPNRGSNRF